MNFQAIADAVISFYSQKKEEVFGNNIKKEKEKFSWDRMVDVIEKLVYS